MVASVPLVHSLILFSNLERDNGSSFFSASFSPSSSLASSPSFFASLAGFPACAVGTCGRSLVRMAAPCSRIIAVQACIFFLHSSCAASIALLRSPISSTLSSERSFSVFRREPAASSASFLLWASAALIWPCNSRKSSCALSAASLRFLSNSWRCCSSRARRSLVRCSAASASSLSLSPWEPQPGRSFCSTSDSSFSAASNSSWRTVMIFCMTRRMFIAAACSCRCCWISACWRWRSSSCRRCCSLICSMRSRFCCSIRMRFSSSFCR
mmetsp:Transcript_29172/g.84473  ORF Transcript_29172/g.84473 Transcript_29172/m.84473 type:complete len:269 (+) Transcript_29172:1214-2020(+)